MNWASKSFQGLIATALAVSGAVSLAQSTITTRELGSVHPLEVDVGGNLPSSVWSTGEASALRASLTALPPSNSDAWVSAPAARLALNALLSGGRPPNGLRDDETVAVLRADRALGAGRAEQVYELLSRTPEINRQADLSELYAETAFALGQIEAACRAAAALLTGRDGPYWLRARAACLAFEGNIPAAELTSELARTSSSNPSFDRVFDAFTLGSGLPSNTRVESGLELAIAERLAPETRIDVAASAPGWLKSASERTGPAITLSGTLPEALEAAVQMRGADREAALGALIQQDFDRVIAAEALAIRLRDAREAGAFLEVADAYGPEVAGLPITPDTLANGVLFVMAALGADDVVAAASWHQALLDGPPRVAPRPALGPDGLPRSTGPGLTAPGVGTQLSPPDYANPVEDALAWTPPDPAELVAVDFARKIASDDIRSSAFTALLLARLENGSPARLCQAAALVALGARDGGELRTALIGAERGADAAKPVFGALLLSARGRALGETQLLAADLLNRHSQDLESCAVSAMALDMAGLRAAALRLVLEQVLEEPI